MMKVLVVLMLVCSVYAEETEILSDPQPSLQDVHAALREISASLAKQELEMRNLQAENKEQAAKQQIEVEELKKQLQGKQVAFSASLVATVSQTFAEPTTLVFKHVVTNIGNAYSPFTGAFTAPLKGAYHFEWHIFGQGGIPTGAVLVKNSENIFIAYEYQPSGQDASPSNGASLLLEAGDVVFLRQWAGTTVHDSINHHTTFSGHMLFTM